MFSLRIMNDYCLLPLHRLHKTPLILLPIYASLAMLSLYAQVPGVTEYVYLENTTSIN